MKPSRRPSAGLLVIAAFIPILFLGGCANCGGKAPVSSSSLRTLRAGESEVVDVNARRKLQPSGLMLEAGATYLFSADPDDTWVDLWKPANAGGYDLGFFGWAAGWKRVPSARWFALIAKIGAGDDFPVELESPKTAPAGGELYFYGNDICWMYWNNFGSISVTVTRVE